MANDVKPDHVQANHASEGPEQMPVSPTRTLPPAAIRALEEAEARRKAALQAQSAERPQEINGPRGPEPTRYGDWERKGMASDF